MMTFNMLKGKRTRIFALATVAASLGVGVVLRRHLTPTAVAAEPAAEPTIDQPKVPVGSWPMWGLTPHRNAVSPEKNPPTSWDISTGKNILWSQPVGSKCYGNPIVDQGIVTIGTNNEGHRDPSNIADGGVEMAF